MQLGTSRNADQQVPSAPKVRRADAARASLAIPAFRRVWLTLLVGSMGMYGVVLVAGLYAYQLSHSSVLAAAAYTLVLLPTVIVGPLAGGYVDRHERARVMRLGVLISAAALAVLAVADALHVTSAFLVLGTCAVVGVGRALYGAAWQALVPEILPTKDLVSGGSLMQVAQQGGQALGPLLIGVLMALFGTSSGFLGCLVLYLLAVAIASRVQGGREASHRSEHAGDGAIQGLVRIVQTRPLGLWLMFVGLHCSLTMAFMGLLPAFATNQLHDQGFDSVLMTVIGVGAILGAGSLSVAHRSIHAGRVSVISGLLSGLSLAMLGLSHNLAIAIVAALVAGGSQATFMAVSYAMVQGNAPADLRGRVAGYSNTMTAGAMSILSTAWGSLQHPFGFAATLIAPGIIFAAITVGFTVRLALWTSKRGILPIAPATPTS